MSYKKLGKYIKLIDNRNRDLSDAPLLGVSVQKRFITSIANTIGSDMSKYKLIEKNNFVYIADTSRRGDKIGIALLKDFDKAMISQAYTSFKIIDENELSPDYLMMWFSRPEFDRYARYHSIGSVREVFDWKDMCEVELPIPSIEEQRQIVEQYQSIANKIKVNEQICEKLEATAQALYKHWFVDFEFPNGAGKPYKSSGGKMVWNEELGKEIPEGWEVVKVKDFCDEMKSGGTPSRDNLNYWNSNDIPWLKTGEVSNNVVFGAEEYISKEGYKNSSAKLIPTESVLMAMYGATAGQLTYLKKEVSTNQACCAMICFEKERSAFLYYALLNQQKQIETLAIGGAQPNLSKQIIEAIDLILPKNLKEVSFFKFTNIIDLKAYKTLENIKLTQLQSLLLSRLSVGEEVSA